MPTIADLGVEIHVDGLNKFQAGLKSASASVEKLENEVEKSSGGLNKFNRGLDGMGAAVAGAFTIGAVVAFGQAVINTTANFQKMEAVLTNTLGSQSAAQDAMLMIQDIAAKTPFAVDQLTASYVKLANRGIAPTADQIVKLGDLASSTGKDFDLLTEALLDAMTGEFERLKEFGVRASSQGDKVAFTFKGVTTTVQKTDKAIKDYILSLGDLEGVQGANAKISATLGGQISNLGDTFTSLFKVIGDGSSGPLSYAVTKLNEIGQALVYIAKSEDQLKTEKISGAMKDYVAGVENISSSKGFEEHLALINERYDKMAAGQDAVLRRITEMEAGAGVLDGIFPTDKAKEIDRLRGSFNAFAIELQGISKSITFTKEAYDKFLASGGGNVQAVGILKTLQAELKALQDAQVNATSGGQIEGINAQIYAKEQEIKKYLELGDAQRNQIKALADLNKELQLNNTLSRGLGDSYDYIESRRGTLENGLKSLLTAGFAPGSESIRRFKAELSSLPQAFELLKPSFENTLPSWSVYLENFATHGKFVLTDIKAGFAALMGEVQKVPIVTAPALEATKTALDTFNEQATAAVQSFTLNTTSGILEMVGAMAAGVGSMGDIGKFLLGSLADLAIQLGTYALTIGLGIEGIRTSLSSLNPVAALAAGAALIALGGFAKAAISGMGKSMGSSGGGSAPAPYKSPTTSATYRQAGASDTTVRFEIDGRSLVGVLKNENYNSFRAG
ncbi:tape measure protein [Nibribacter koreensis]|uniref:Tape measure protein N-terminal domain-containing protein n=1 Tax=Nibribacter koreensis TaxID=1084519 RepID=A0ABP8FAZ2_9BACT